MFYFICYVSSLHVQELLVAFFEKINEMKNLMVSNKNIP